MTVMSEAAVEENRLGRFVDRVTISLMYKPFAMIVSLLGGMLASMLFTRLWRALSGAHDAPDATDDATRWADIVPAAALHGLVFGVVKALVDRAGAKEFQRMTGRWPGKRSLARTPHSRG